MKDLTIVAVALLCVIVSPTTTMGGWPKPSEVSNEERLMNTGQPQPHLYAAKFNFGESKIWKCTYNNGSGVAISITYPSPTQPPSQKPPTPSSPSTPKMAPPSPKPSPPRPTPKKSPPPPNPSFPPPEQSPPSPKPSPPHPIPKKSPPPPNPSLPPPKQSSPPPKPSPPHPTPKKSPPPPKPSPPLTPENSSPSPTPSPSPPAPIKSHPPPKTSNLIIHSPPPPHEPIQVQSPPKAPTTPSTPWPHYQIWNPLGHFINCITERGPMVVCREQVEISYYTGRFRVSDYCCNLFVNMRNECFDVLLGFYTDRHFLPLLRCTCHVKIY